MTLPMRASVMVLASLTVAAAHEQPRNRIGMRFDAQVVSIGDGDTLELIPLGETERLRIRLDGIDAPELAEPYGREATAFTRTLLFKQRVRVDGRDIDRYGRLVARVTVGTRDASHELLQAGLACYFTQFASDPVLGNAESRARLAGLGFWAPTARKPRCTGVTNTTTKASSYRGNVSSRLYHAASCPNANCRNCTRGFASEAEARAAGFKPAADCLRR